jgi:hypothetical protein
MYEIVRICSMQVTVDKDNIFVSKPQGKKPRHRWQYSIKIDIKELGYGIQRNGPEWADPFQCVFNILHGFSCVA